MGNKKIRNEDMVGRTVRNINTDDVEVVVGYDKKDGVLILEDGKSGNRWETTQFWRCYKLVLEDELQTTKG